MKQSIPKQELLKKPNALAPKIRILSIFGKIRIILGYQMFLFIYTMGKPVPLNELLIRKNEVIGPFFQKYFLKKNIESFADIGGNNGFFSFLAQFYGTKDVTTYDIDHALDRLYDSTFYKHVGLKIDYNDIFTINRTYDCILGISIMHWLVGQIFEKESTHNIEQILDTIMNNIAKITKKVAIIEFVLSEDKVITNFGHHNFKIGLDDYLKSSAKFFTHSELLGYSNKTRIIYALWKGKGAI